MAAISSARSRGVQKPGWQVGILGPLYVLHQLGGFQGNAGAQGPQVSCSLLK